MKTLKISHSWQELDKKLGFSEETGCEEVISRLKSMALELDHSGILYNSFDILCELLSDTEVICEIPGEEFKFDKLNTLKNLVNDTPTMKKVQNDHEAWIRILNWVASDIQELFRYSYTAADEPVSYLKDLLEFLSSLDVLVNHTRLYLIQALEFDIDMFYIGGILEPKDGMDISEMKSCNYSVFRDFGCSSEAVISKIMKVEPSNGSRTQTYLVEVDKPLYEGLVFRT